MNRSSLGLISALLLTAALFSECLAQNMAEASAAMPANGVGFDALLQEAELQFLQPEGFVDLPAGRTPVLDYERALRSVDGKLEIRIAVRPLKRLQIDYDDPHGAVPNPNHIFPLVFESLATRLAGGGHAPSNEYPPDQAKRRFNADWAAATVFDAVESFDSRHRQGLMVAIHRNKVSDAYLVVLFDDYPSMKGRIDQALTTLRFQPRRAGSESG